MATVKTIEHAEFVRENKPFINACEKAGLEPTKKQASKYRNGKGLAFKFRKHPTTKYLKRQVELNLAGR